MRLFSSLSAEETKDEQAGGEEFNRAKRGFAATFDAVIISAVHFKVIHKYFRENDIFQNNKTHFNKL